MADDLACFSDGDDLLDDEWQDAIGFSSERGNLFPGHSLSVLCPNCEGAPMADEVSSAILASN